VLKIVSDLHCTLPNDWELTVGHPVYDEESAVAERGTSELFDLEAASSRWFRITVGPVVLSMILMVFVITVVLHFDLSVV
jgi:hypothetical protein